MQMQAELLRRRNPREMRVRTSSRDDLTERLRFHEVDAFKDPLPIADVTRVALRPIQQHHQSSHGRSPCTTCLAGPYVS